MIESKTKNSEFLQITRHDKFYSRLLSKEISSSTPSFRVYYGGASGAVPFLWESQPGTPKNAIQTNTPPPLTPPPSYQSKDGNKQTRANKSPPPKISALMHCMLPRLSPKRATNLLPLSPSVSSSRSSASRSSFSSEEGSSPNSMLCYKTRHGGNNGGGGGLRGCNSMVLMKNALLSIVGGHGSSQGTTAAA